MRGCAVHVLSSPQHLTIMALHFVATSVLTSDGIDGGKEEALETEEARRSRKEAEEAGRKPLFEQLRMLKEKQQEEFDANTKLMYGPQMALTEEDAEYLDDVERTRSKAMEARAVTEQRALEAFRAARSQLVVSSSVVALEGNSTYADPSRVPAAGAPLSAASSSSTAAAGAGGGYLVIPAKKDNASTFTAQPVITAKKRRKVDDAHGNSSNSSSNSGNASSNGSGGKGGGGGDGQEPSKRAKGAAEGDAFKPSNAGAATAGPAGGGGGGGGGAALSLLGGYGSDEDED